MRAIVVFLVMLLLAAVLLPTAQGGRKLNPITEYGSMSWVKLHPITEYKVKAYPGPTAY